MPARRPTGCRSVRIAALCLIARSALAECDRFGPKMVAGLRNPSAPIRAAAAECVGLTINSQTRLEPDQQEALGLLAGLLGDADPTVRAAAVRAVGWISYCGTPYRDAVARLLHDPAPAVQANAAAAVGSLRADCPANVDMLVQLGRSPVVDVRTAALKSLMALAARDPRSTEAVLRGLIDAPAVRKEALVAFMTEGFDGTPAVAELDRELDDPSPRVRMEALGALGGVGQPARSATDRIAGRCADPVADVRHAALWTLHRIGAETAVLEPRLKAALADPDPTVRALAQRLWTDPAGRRWQEREPAVLSVLAKGLADSATSVRESTVQSLGKQVHDADAASALAVGALTDPSPEVRWTAAEALGELGVGSPPVVEALLHRLDDPVRGVRQGVCRAFARIHPREPAVVPALCRAFRTEQLKPQPPPRPMIGDPPWSPLWAYVEALTAFGPEAEPCLIEALQDENATVRYSAAGGLERIPWSGRASRALLAATADRDDYVARLALNALGRHGSTEDLIAAARLASPLMRRWVVSQFAEFGHVGRSALASLAEDPDQALRKAARQTLKMPD